jgi:hypothetical protein
VRLIANARRLATMKAAHAVRARNESHAHLSAEKELRAAAHGVRHSAQSVLDMAELAAESGLSRLALYERLRLLGLARGQFAEAALEGARLEENAAVRSAQAQASKELSVLMDRKHRKLDFWASRAERIQINRTEHRDQVQAEEEHACRQFRQ